MITLIAAVAHNNVIGSSKTNDLLWYLPEDFKHFARTTKGSPVIMGRKTYESIINRNGKPLPGRMHFIITRDETYKVRFPETVKVCTSLSQALAEAQKISSEVFVIGGQSMFEKSINLADKLIITEVDADFPQGDVYFPEYKLAWQERARMKNIDKATGIKFDFVTYLKK